ncbi:DNA translocase FtsK 4TM domain-containing protein [candidate division WWE3 bacterium]|nr:DNA translocase FtsK 4TM domain-containing protein [candidate division WWE3 bacterium]
MPKGRRRSRKFKIESGVLKSTAGIGLMLLGLLSLISVFTQSGSLLSIFYETQNELFGLSAILFSLTLILVALLMFESIKSKLISYRALTGLVVSLVSFSSLFKILLSDEAGGELGIAVAQVLNSGVTVYGSFLVLLAALVISFVLVFNISLDQVFEYISDFKEKLISAKPKIKLRGAAGESFENGGGEEELKVKRKIKEPAFEIIPPPSEPVDHRVRNGDMPLVKTHTPSGLPYTDRVWEYPPIDLLSDISTLADRGDVNSRKHVIEKTLSSFGIKARVAETNFGPAVTQYALETISGTKIAKVTNLQNDIALALASPTGSVRIEAPIPGKPLIGIEVPNISTAIVNFKSMITSDAMKSAKSKLTIGLGHNVSGLPCVSDVARMPHILIAGSTGSGKSVFLHSVIFSLLFRCSPAECKLILVDPKRVELVHYNDIPHLMVPVITDPEKAPNALRWAVAEMERRYKLFESAKVRNITSYNELSGFQALPYIVIIVDELAELMAIQLGEVERAICRLAQLSRATGVHLILATQSPRVDVITGLIKANIPTRIAFSVSSQIESRIIIDTVGAEKLLGKGDMLYVPPETAKPVRIQGVFVSDKEITNLVAFLRNSGVRPEFREEVLRPQQPRNDVMESNDELFEEAVKIVTLSDRASASLLQRKLSIGYARAARLLDELEAKGIVGAADGSKPRDVLIRNPESISSLSDGDI